MDTQPEAQAPAPVVFDIVVTKAKQSIPVDWASLPPEVQLYVVKYGLEKLLNTAAGKITKNNTDSAEEMATLAMAEANKKLDALKAGKTGRASAKASKVDRTVMTEAKRLALNVIKAGIKANNERISDYASSSLTAAAAEYLAEHPELIAMAQETVTAANVMAEVAKTGVVAGIAKDPDKVKKNDAKRKTDRETTAAKKAGMPGPQASQLKRRPVPTRPEVRAGA